MRDDYIKFFKNNDILIDDYYIRYIATRIAAYFAVKNSMIRIIRMRGMVDDISIFLYPTIGNNEIKEEPSYKIAKDKWIEYFNDDNYIKQYYLNLYDDKIEDFIKAVEKYNMIEDSEKINYVAFAKKDYRLIISTENEYADIPKYERYTIYGFIEKDFSDDIKDKIKKRAITIGIVKYYFTFNIDEAVYYLVRYSIFSKYYSMNSNNEYYILYPDGDETIILKLDDNYIKEAKAKWINFIYAYILSHYIIE